MASWCFIIFFGVLPFNHRPVADSVVQITVSETRVRAGEAGVINLYVTVKEGYHIQAHVVYDEFLVPAKIELADSGIISVVEMKFPPGRKFRLEGASDFLYVYDGDFTVTISFQANKKLLPQKYSLNGKLHYQACDMKTCLRPRSTDFVISLTIR
jgi:DsbC/DsbD-like thiol-disulfide interchange protein